MFNPTALALLSGHIFSPSFAGMLSDIHPLLSMASRSPLRFRAATSQSVSVTEDGIEFETSRDGRSCALKIENIKGPSPKMFLSTDGKSTWKETSLADLTAIGKSESSEYSKLLEELLEFGFRTTSKSLKKGEKILKAKEDSQIKVKPEDDSQVKAESKESTEGSQPTNSTAVAPTTPIEHRTIRIIRQDSTDLEFEGKLLASVASNWKDGRRVVFAVFQTKGGRFVALKSGQTLWAGEQYRNTVVIENSSKEVIKFFGFSPLAKTLFNELNWPTVERIA